MQTSHPKPRLCVQPNFLSPPSISVCLFHSSAQTHSLWFSPLLGHAWSYQSSSASLNALLQTANKRQAGRKKERKRKKNEPYLSPSSLGHSFILRVVFIFIYVCLCVGLCARKVRCLQKPEESIWSPWNCIYKWFWCIQGELGTKLGSPVRAASYCNHGAISPVPGSQK